MQDEVFPYVRCKCHTVQVNYEVFLRIFNIWNYLLGSKCYLIFSGIFIECQFIVAQGRTWWCNVSTYVAGWVEWQSSGIHELNVGFWPMLLFSDGDICVCKVLEYIYFVSTLIEEAVIGLCTKHTCCWWSVFLLQALISVFIAFFFISAHTVKNLKLNLSKEDKKCTVAGTFKPILKYELLNVSVHRM